MESRYEIATKTIVPLVREALVIELTEKHNKTEEEIASILGVTQAAISKKIKKNLNRKIDEKINIDKSLIEEYAIKIVDGSETAQNCICKVCNSVNDFGCKFSSIKNK